MSISGTFSFKKPDLITVYPLDRPLHKWNSRFTNTLDTNKVKDIILKILLVVASIFVIPALGITKLSGRIFGITSREVEPNPSILPEYIENRFVDFFSKEIFQKTRDRHVFLNLTLSIESSNKKRIEEKIQELYIQSPESIKRVFQVVGRFDSFQGQMCTNPAVSVEAYVIENNRSFDFFNLRFAEITGTFNIIWTTSKTGPIVLQEDSKTFGAESIPLSKRMKDILVKVITKSEMLFSHSVTFGEKYPSFGQCMMYGSPKFLTL